MIEVFFGNLLFIWGLHKLLTAEWSILSVVGDIISERIPENLAKPLFTCPMCMSSVWSVGFLFTGLQWYYWPIYSLCLLGASALICSFLYSDCD